MVIIIAVQYDNRKTNVDREVKGKNNYENSNCDGTVKNPVIIGIISIASLSKNINIKRRKILTKVFKCNIIISL